MGAIGTGKLTLLDHARRIDPDGKIAKIAEVMNETNSILDDAVTVEGNTTSGHKTTMRTGLPTSTWRQLNKGVQPSKSTTKQLEFTCGLLENHGQIDEELVNLAIDKAAFRLSENAPQIESMSQTLADTLIYGDITVNPERFTGLTPYYNSTGADTATNIIAGGSVGADNTSMWLVCWSENTIHCFYPRGSKAGIEHNDLGKLLIEDGITTGSRYMAWVDQYKSRLGLAVRDWRYAVRICNLDVSDLATSGDQTDTSANLLKYMIQAINKIPNINAGRAAFYCNKEVKTALDIKAMEKSNVLLSLRELENGKLLTSFLGIPIRRVDAIKNDESLVS